MGRPSHPRAAVSRAGARTPVVASGRAVYGYRFGTHFRPFGFYRPWWWFSASIYWPYSYGYWYGPPYGGYPYGYNYRYSHAGPASVETDVTPRQATVKLDGEDVGEAKDYDGRWDQLGVDPGKHVLEFEADGYQTLRVPIDARPGSHYRIGYRLHKGDGVDPRSESVAPEAMPGDRRPEADQREDDDAPPMDGAARGDMSGGGFLKMHISPSDAAIYLDGEFLATASEVTGMHGAVPVPEGEHRIEIVRPGFATRKMTIHIESGKSADVSVDLEKGGGAGDET
jgi:hypothetical protein